MSKSLNINSDPAVKDKLASYPTKVRSKMKKLRKLILDTAKEIDSVEELEETLKWGEPSYLTKKGSTLRMDWKEKKPDQYALYFKCTSKLISAIKTVYDDFFNYETTRAILFNLDEDPPEKEIKHCIELALTYHLIKDRIFEEEARK